MKHEALLRMMLIYEQSVVLKAIEAYAEDCPKDGAEVLAEAAHACRVASDEPTKATSMVFENLAKTAREYAEAYDFRLKEG